ncbi:MAG: theronine dehydrogenase [Betaproteobacteria bacterium]|nr:MAG: theronine dehydrogenase [Betaproteobacteria bacterium]
MEALSIIPGRAGSLRLAQVEEPPAWQGSVLVSTLAVGVCGTDRELIDGKYGKAPEGKERLVLGHESLGRVVDAPRGGALRAGDVVVGIVRHPDPVPCVNCALGEWDMCRNGLYTERGIKQADGFAARRWRAEPEFLVKVSASLGLAGVLLEPASVVAKGWEHIERIGRRARWAPCRALVTGAGTVGLMAALLGLQRGLEVHLFDRNDSGPKPELARSLGASYHVEYPTKEFDVVIECTGAPRVIAQAVAGCTPDGIVCLAGLGPEHSGAKLDVAALNQSLVLENRVIFGSVNANRRHYDAAAKALERADRAWLERVITSRLPLEDWERAYQRRDNDVKTVIVFED